MDCQDLLETERIRTDIINVADSRRPVQDSVPVKDEGGKKPVGRTKQYKDENAVSTKCTAVGQGGAGQIQQERAVEEGSGVAQGQ